MAVHTPRDNLLYAVDKCRTVLGPTVMDLRPTSISVITRNWSDGTDSGDGFPSDTTLTLPNYTKVRHLSQREIAQSGGVYEDGDIIVGPITPQYTSPVDGVTTGGFTEAQLAPSVTAPAGEVVYRVAQQSGATGLSGDYARVEIRRDRTLRMMLVLRRMRTTPGPL
jgi:hypothetical protein